MLATEWLPVLYTSFLPLYPCTPKMMQVPVAAICCEAVKKRKGKQEPVELFPVLASVLGGEYDLGTKDKRQNQRHC